jgi:3-deoxy-D-manno-octulosonic acid (KDO) 8-phosphate synthase
VTAACRSLLLLLAAAATPCWLNVKKGQFLAPQDMGHVVSKVDEVLFCLGFEDQPRLN